MIMIMIPRGAAGGGRRHEERARAHRQTQRAVPGPRTRQGRDTRSVRMDLSHATALPLCGELSVGRGRVEKRRLAPDAIVELLAERTRVFVEDEMGLAPLPKSTRTRAPGHSRD